MIILDNKTKVLDQLVLAAGSWRDLGGQDKEKEDEFESLLLQLHPDKELAVEILMAHLS